MKIIKRNGAEVVFDIEKIMMAVTKANEAVEDSVRMIPLQIIAVLMILLEIGKQLTSFSQGYDLYHIPLHFCSLVLFMVPIMAFYNGKHTQIIRTITAALCSSVTLLVLIYPVLIYSADNIRGFFHSFMV